MTTLTAPNTVRIPPVDGRSTCDTAINAYEVLNADRFSWPVNILHLEFSDGVKRGHDSRGEAKAVVWDLKRGVLRSQWRGYGFVVDLGPSAVAIPASWPLVNPVTTPECVVSLSKTVTASMKSPIGRRIVEAVVKDAVKKRFKDAVSLELGDLWQDFDAFCQYPNVTAQQESLMCRRFCVSVKSLAGPRLVVQANVSTAMVDGRTFADYYAAGQVTLLAEMIAAKREGRLTRQNRAIGVRVLQEVSSGGARALDLEDTTIVAEHARLSPEEQRLLVGHQVGCRPFKSPRIEIPMQEMRLILGSQNTQDEHAETIIEPNERFAWIGKIRNFLSGCDVQGTKIDLGAELIVPEKSRSLLIQPPRIRVRGEGGKEVVIAPRATLTDDSLRSRSRDRMNHIHRNGFLVQRTISPALAWPKGLDPRWGERLKEHLDGLIKDQGVDASFELVPYVNPDHLARTLLQTACDTAMVVLPERSRQQSDDDTHEQIKRRLDVPSQCIHFDNLLRKDLAKASWSQVKQSYDKQMRRARQRYELCVGNLLVKHHWFPFAPADPFHYNVHVGLDVGGMHNTRAVACIGYGFRSPSKGIIFRPDEIAIESQKKEPIPTESLYRGLMESFERVRSDLIEARLEPDFDSVLFHRDGKLMGDGDEWNERDALCRLHAEMRNRGWVRGGSIWSVAEISKTAETWRLLRPGLNSVRNPLVGFATFPFEDDHVALVATTGSPYLQQGTATPLLITVTDIFGTANPEHVVKDVVWQADMCFSKPDMGMRLPWVLNVADSGALQLSKSYQIAGITA